MNENAFGAGTDNWWNVIETWNTDLSYLSSHENFRTAATSMRSIFALLALIAIGSPLMAQDYTSEERLQGYAIRFDTTIFVFDPEIYGGETPERVMVTGPFRSWSDNMGDRHWMLKPQGEVWTLLVPDTGHTVIPPNSPFKFKINDGVWVAPIADALNERGGNLVYLKDVDQPGLHAEIQNGSTIWASFTDVNAPLDPKAYTLTDGVGNDIPIATVLPNTKSTVLVVPAATIDRRRVHFLEVRSLDLRSLCFFDGWFRSLYSDKELGANVADDGSGTTFRIFSPRADSVRLYLYDAEVDTEPIDTVNMIADQKGVWEAFFDDDMHGTYYDFTVHGPAERGSTFYEARPVHISDPYSRVNVDAFGRSRVWRKTTPATPLVNGIPPMEDVVAYEMHVQDFTDLLPVDDDLRGTIPAVTVPDLKNDAGRAVGFDHLLDLGINVVHLQPVQEFLHYPDDVWQEAFGDDPYMQEMGVADENYQWGYRTTHAFAVETRYRRKGTERGAEREQFRDLVQAFHDKGIAVIIDVVFNHTGEDMDGQHFLLHFNVLDMHYYYRTALGPDDKIHHIGDFCNETKSEERPMVQRWIIDQSKHFIDEFGIDGFRIDLAGQTDEQTLRALRQAIGPDKIVYGEPWIGSNDPRYEANEDWDWYKADAPITYFQDDTRNAIQGPPSNPKDKSTDRGWAGGNAKLRPNVKLALSNSFPDELHPNRGIGYVDIHDNWTLADRFAVTDWDGLQGVEEAPFRLAATLLFTSLGPVVMHGGTEMMRSKGLAPLVEIVKEHGLGATAIHGKRDTYNLRAPNRFVWESLGLEHVAEMSDYWRGLIHFRRSDAGATFRVGEAQPVGYYRWIEPDDTRLLGYFVDENILVLANASEQAQTFLNVELPVGTWRLIGSGTHVDHENGVDGADSHLNGVSSLDLAVPPASALIWIRSL
jgi:pullulanase